MKHLSDEDINSYIDEKLAGKVNYEVKEHINSCETCRNRYDEYMEFMSVLEMAEVFDTGEQFNQKVMANLPDKYVRTEKSLLEIFGLISVSLVALVAMFVFLPDKLFGGFNAGAVFTGISSFFKAVYKLTESVPFIQRNIGVFMMFILYAGGFAVIRKKKKKTYSQTFLDDRRFKT